jgi:hypothetical protein
MLNLVPIDIVISLGTTNKGIGLIELVELNSAWLRNRKVGRKPGRLRFIGSKNRIQSSMGNSGPGFLNWIFGNNPGSEIPKSIECDLCSPIASHDNDEEIFKKL